MALFIDSGFSAPRSPATGLGPNPRTGGFATTPPPRTVAGPGSLAPAPTGPRSSGPGLVSSFVPHTFGYPTFDPNLAIGLDDPNAGDSGGGYGGGGGGWGDGGAAYAAALAEQQLGISQIDANEKAARERAIIGFGDPALAGLAGFGLDPQAGDFARQNYLSGNSTLSRLDKDKADKRNAMINQLASHGILFSGDTGYQEGQQATQYGNAVYDARNKVLDYLRQVDQDAQDRKNQLRQMVISAMQMGGGGGGGGGGSGSSGWNLTVPGGNQAGANLSAVQSAAQAMAAQRGWTAPVGNPSGPELMNQGMTFTDPNGRRYVEVKFGTPGGNSTEKVYVP